MSSFVNTFKMIPMMLIYIFICMFSWFLKSQGSKEKKTNLILSWQACPLPKSWIKTESAIRAFLIFCD